METFFGHIFLLLLHKKFAHFKHFTLNQCLDKILDAFSCNLMWKYAHGFGWNENKIHWETVITISQSELKSLLFWTSRSLVRVCWPLNKWKIFIFWELEIKLFFPQIHKIPVRGAHQEAWFLLLLTTNFFMWPPKLPRVHSWPRDVWSNSTSSEFTFNIRSKKKKTIKIIYKAIPTALSYRARDICCKVWTAKASNLMYPFLFLILHVSCYGGHHERLQIFHNTLNVWARTDLVIKEYNNPYTLQVKKIKHQNGQGNCPRSLI